MPRKESATPSITAKAQQELVSDGIENYELPKSLVTKIAKSAIPDNAKLQKETVLSLVKGSTVFINYLAATAHDVALSKQHKSISASDVLKALELIEFGDLNDMLQSELQVYRNNLKTDKSKKERAEKAAAKGKAKEDAAAASASASISAALNSTPKSKGKEKAPMLPPLTYTPRPISTTIAGGDEDTGMDVEEAEAEDEREGDGEIPEDDEIDVDVDEGEDIEDDGQPEDPMAIEDEELREDAKGVEERVAAVGE